MPSLSKADHMGFFDKLRLINWSVVSLIALICFIGIALQYSSGGKSWSPWAAPQLTRFIVGFALMLFLALIDIRFWLRWAYPIYGVMLALLVIVEIMGHVGMGAQRWINLGFFVLQPSELMKLALILGLAKYFHALDVEEVGRPMMLVPPALMALAPTGLVLMQPNLGTAGILLMASGALFFVAGVRWWKFLLALALSAVALPYAWNHLHDYQKARLMTFLDPNSDPLGRGYNIIQSKIAMGSGGLFGKGFGQGTQSQLQFLPEKHTDFIFVVLGEEFGMAGAMFLFSLYFLLLSYGMLVALTSRSQFGRLTAFGLTTCFFLHIFINVAMVTGTIPVVGIPLPLISYGGTSLLTLLMACGLLLGLSIHREVRISRSSFDII